MYNVENKCNDCGEHWETENKNMSTVQRIKIKIWEKYKIKKRSLKNKNKRKK